MPKTIGWEVSSLKLETNTSDPSSDFLFTNGLMQVPVIVSIKAIKKQDASHHTLSNEDLASIKLVHYHNPFE